MSANAGWTTESGTARTGTLVCTRLANIQRTDQTIIFAGATFRGPGTYRSKENPDDRIMGNAWISPPMLGPTNVWSVLAFQETGELNVNFTEGVPARRYNGLVATSCADGHVESQTSAALTDMRRWIDTADRVDFTHKNN